MLVLVVVLVLDLFAREWLASAGWFYRLRLFRSQKKRLRQRRGDWSGINNDFMKEALAQRYAEVRKGMGLKIVGYAADSILEVLVAKINPILRVPLRPFARDPINAGAEPCRVRETLKWYQRSLLGFSSQNHGAVDLLR